MKIVYNLILLILFHLIYFTSYSINHQPISSKNNHSNKSGCAPASSNLRIELNNVKALIATSGTLFLDRTVSKSAYEVPKNSGIHAIYASSLWMGGIDENGQLKLAAHKYESTGHDFFSGPLSNGIIANSGNYNPLKPQDALTIKTFGDATINSDQCLAYDQFFQIRKQEVIQFVKWNKCQLNSNQTFDCTTISVPSNDILNRINSWPAHGDVSIGQDRFLAPFYDSDKNGEYDPSKGDYPWFDDILGHDDISCGDRRVSLYGDETNWWIFNDKGNVHSESGGNPIGLEVRAQAFTFLEVGNDSSDLNNATFFNYEIINKSTSTIKNMSVSQFVDGDLGFYKDDYVGCDVSRGLGYFYNADNYDEDTIDIKGYGFNPPAIGIDFFEGLYQDADNLDNPGPQMINGQLITPTVMDAISNNGIVYAGLGQGYGDGIVDNERLGMKYFSYYTALSSASMSDPTSPAQFYNYMIGKWRFGDKAMYGGSGFPGSNFVTNVPSNYMFPGDSDTLNWGTGGIDTGLKNWSEITNNNIRGDRRFVSSMGSITLKPGQINSFTTGVIYARSQKSHLLASVEKLQKVDTKIQDFFNSCFEIYDGKEFKPEDKKSLKVTNIELNNLLIYPNPATEKIAVKLTENGIYTLNLYNVNGALILTEKTQNVNYHVLNVEDLTPGMYILKITASGNSISKKVQIK
jgi:hypothetical protein